MCEFSSNSEWLSTKYLVFCVADFATVVVMIRVKSTYPQHNNKNVLNNSGFLVSFFSIRQCIVENLGKNGEYIHHNFSVQ